MGTIVLNFNVFKNQVIPSLEECSNILNNANNAINNLIKFMPERFPRKQIISNIYEQISFITTNVKEVDNYLKLKFEQASIIDKKISSELDRILSRTNKATLSEPISLSTLASPTKYSETGALIGTKSGTKNEALVGTLAAVGLLITSQALATKKGIEETNATKSSRIVSKAKPLIENSKDTGTSVARNCHSLKWLADNKQKLYSKNIGKRVEKLKNVKIKSYDNTYASVATTAISSKEIIKVAKDNPYELKTWDKASSKVATTVIGLTKEMLI